MRVRRKFWFWIGVCAAAAVAQKFTDMPVVILMLGAFFISIAVSLWDNHKFNRKLAQMAREVKERGNV